MIVLNCSCSVADQKGKALDAPVEMFSKWLKSPSVPKVHVSTLGGPSDPGISFSVDLVLTLSQFISPQSERSELGAFYFFQGVLSGYCCVCESGYYHVKKKGYCNEVGYRGSSEMSQIWVLW